MRRQIRVLVVDDSAMMRRMIKQILETDPGLEVVGTARDGQDALEKASALRPDVVTLDINMPVMDGLTCLLLLLEQQPDIGVVMLSSLTQEGAVTTFEALELGAFDYVAKPSGTISSNLYIVGKELIAKVKAAAHRNRRRRVKSPKLQKSKPIGGTKAAPRMLAKNEWGSGVPAQIAVVIGVSTGGPGTLMEILPKLPEDLNAVVIVVQHMPPVFTSTFAQRLNRSCRMSFSEAKAGDRLLAGHGFVAPGGRHLVVKRNVMRDECMVRLTNTPSDTAFKPSVDVTMMSVLKEFGKNMVGVLLTGMGDDGADAMVKVRAAGGITIAEDESTAVVFGMPKEAIARGGAEIVAPAHCIADEIINGVSRIKHHIDAR